jgi:DNA-binding transcriptional ArsR family regulator
MTTEPGPARSLKRLTDPKALRALAHPTRLALVGLLRSEGQLTATRAAELLGQSSGSTSFHLRQLAKYGLVEEVGGRHGRERPWRATAMFTTWDATGAEPNAAAAAQLLESVVTDMYFSDVVRWQEARETENPEWQRASEFGDTFVYLTPAELTDVSGAVRRLLDPYLDRSVQPELRPPGSRLVRYLHIAHPLLGRDAKRQEP